MTSLALMEANKATCFFVFFVFVFCGAVRKIAGFWMKRKVPVGINFDCLFFCGIAMHGVGNVQLGLADMPILNATFRSSMPYLKQHYRTTIESHHMKLLAVMA